MDRERGSLCPSGSRPCGVSPTGNGSAPALGVALDGARRRLAAGGRLLSPPLAVVVLLLVTAVSALVVAPARSAGAAAASAPEGAPAAPAAAAGDAGTTSSKPPLLTLRSQTPWVAPGQPFDLKLALGAGAPAPADLGLSLAVYPCLSTVSAFDQAMAAPSGPTTTPLSRTSSPIAWTSLHAAAGVVDLPFPVVTTGSPPSAAGGPGGFTISLHATSSGCQAYPSGVYPVRVELVNTTTDTVLGAMTTALVYIQADPTTKLRFALVVPVNIAMAPAVAPTRASLRAAPSAALAQPSKRTVETVDQLVQAIHDHATVPVTIAATPQTVQTLGADGHQSTVDTLAQLPPLTHQLAVAPYVPVNASQLVGAGLSTELATQVTQGKQVLAADIARSGPTGSATTAAASSGAWITNDDVDDSTLTQLQAAGYDQLILPSSDVSSAPTNGSAAEPFVVSPSGGSTVTAVTSNADLASRFTAHPDDPVLAANQMLAELAQIYYERPNDSSRAVVAVAPTGWKADPTFIETVLNGLDATATAGSPIIQAVTTAALFQSFTAPAPCRTECRLNAPPAGSGGLPVAAIRAQRTKVDGFASGIPASAHPIDQQLSQLVLAGEAETLQPPQQSAVLHNTASALDAQLDQLTVSADPITLTSRQANVPIVSIVSSAPYPITGTLTLTSDKLLFANGTQEMSKQETITGGSADSPHNNVFYFNVTARASGEFKVIITLQAPSGDLVLTNGLVNVRSTATSVVGVVLSLGAVVVLLVWWLRTTMRRRPRRHSRAPEAP